jgi:hypothetical protein
VARLTRRDLLAGAGVGAAGLTALNLGGVLESLARAAEALPPPALLPDDPAVRATIEAFADTIVPGPAGGADSRPGAIEAGVMEEIYDPFYGAYVTFPLIHDDLLLTTPAVLGRVAGFDLQLPYPDRELVLRDRLRPFNDGGSSPLYVIHIGVATLVYLSYYGNARSELGPRTIRFPPESDGYWPDHSYRVGFAGMTKDGNLE